MLEMHLNLVKAQGGAGVANMVSLLIAFTGGGSFWLCRQKIS